tara:strand:- start:1365 stop:2102 length:738 start_codon:yes stop_codon:yes gene_type:complete
MKNTLKEKKINKLTIGLPCYNEEKNIEKSIKECFNFIKKNNISHFEILIIDNKSTDKSVEIIQKNIKKKNYKNLKLIKNKKNILYSGSVEKIIKNSKFNLVAIMDSDNQYDPNDIFKLYKSLNNKDLDLVIGKRSYRQDSIFRKIVSKFFLIISRILIDNNLSDLNCGIRILKKNSKIKKYITHKLNFCNPEIYIQYKINNLKIGEVNINHFNRDNGKSIHTFTNLFKTIIVVILYLFKLSKVKK